MGVGCAAVLLGSVEATTLEGVRHTIAQGPVASQEAIKLLGHQRGRVLQRQLVAFL